MTEEAKVPPKAPPLSPIFISMAETKRLVYAVEVPPGVSLARVMEPDYLGHVAPKLQEGFLLEVQASDNAWRAELMVRKIDLKKHEVHCWKLSYVDLNAQLGLSEKPAADQFTVAFGGAHKWRVIRLSDNEPIHTGEPSKADAQAWLDNFLKTPA